MVKLFLSLLLAGVLLLISWGAYLEYLVRHWDEKIAKLCAADGGRNVGLRVYERVVAPASYIRPASGAMPSYVKVPWRYEGKILKDDEPIVEEFVDLNVLRYAKPRVANFARRIVRRSDSKVLTEEIGYYRNGGGIPLPTPGDSLVCPTFPQTTMKTAAFYNEVFINHPFNENSLGVK